MKFTVTGILHMHGVSKKTNNPYNFVTVAGNFSYPRFTGLRAREFNIGMDMLEGVVPEVGDVLLLDVENDRVLSVEWISHASATLACSSSGSSSGSAAKTVGNNHGQPGSK